MPICPYDEYFEAVSLRPRGFLFSEGALVTFATWKARTSRGSRRSVSEMTHVSLRGTGTTLGDNVGLVAALIAVVVAQVLKPFSEWAITGRFKASLMVGSGGFPSSHSSLVTALATGTACQAGLGDPAFATALVLALVVRPHLVNTHFYSVPAVASLFAPSPFTRAKTLTSARSTAIL